MIALRHKQLWLSWIVGLSLVITGVLSPAQASACVEVATVRAGQQSKACPTMAASASCCCAPGQKVTRSHPAPHGAALRASGCGCTVQAPSEPAPPAAKPLALVYAPDLALVPVSQVQIELPRTIPWVFAAPATGPPPSPLPSSGPSRAPPAL